MRRASGFWTFAFALVGMFLAGGSAVSARTLREALQARGVYQDLYFGPRFTKGSDLDAPAGKFSDVGWKTGVTWGMRFGYWHNRYFGGALDVFAFDTTPKSQNVTFTGGGLSVPNVSLDDSSAKIESKALAFDLLARYPIGNGLMPYAGIAPTVYLNHATLLGFGVEGSGTNFGFQIPVGLKYIFANSDKLSFGAMTEVRFAYNPASVNVGRGDVSANLFSTHVLFGLSLGYDL